MKQNKLLHIFLKITKIFKFQNARVNRCFSNIFLNFNKIYNTFYLTKIQFKYQKNRNKNYNIYIMKKLVFGIALLGFGTLAMAQKTHPTEQQKAEWQAKKAEIKKMQEQKRMQNLSEMEKDLNLNKSQVAQIKAMQDRNIAERKAENQKNKELKKQKMQMMKQKREAMNNQMKQILSAEQYAKWEANKKAKMQDRKENFKNRKGNFDGMKKEKMHKKIDGLQAS